MAAISPQAGPAPMPIEQVIDHLVVVMLENRSFDTMLGWLYPDGEAQPARQIPAGSAARAFDGLHAELWNPRNPGFFRGDPPKKIFISRGAADTTIPDPDPLEDFNNVTEQLYGQGQAASQTPAFPNLGFAVNYLGAAADADPAEIMEAYSPQQLPVLSGLARSFAVCDAWFSSVPTDTWPNRAFLHAGTSNGNVVNGDPVDPARWNVKTIFETLEEIGVSWKVYCDTLLTPPLTLLMFPRLARYAFDRFAHFDAFKKDCAAGRLPRYSFLEPSFLDDPNDQHPPHDVVAGEQFLYAIWQAVSQSPKWSRTLLLITYDEHGGTYDHAMPPWGAACPDAASDPGQEGFGFDRFGVRVPAVAASPWIAPGTVFRSDREAPYDHASIAATLRDWLKIPAERMPPSQRIAMAPTLGQLLTEERPRSAPAIPAPAAEIRGTSLFLPPNDLQRSLIAAQAARSGDDPQQTLSGIKTREEAARYFRSKGPTPQAQSAARDLPGPA